MTPTIGDSDIAECADCGAIWLGPTSFDDSLKHHRETKHSTSVTTRI